MQDEANIQHIVNDDKIIIEVLTNRFTHDLVHVIKNDYPINMLYSYKEVEFNLRSVKMIDSSSIGMLFEINNKLRAHNKDTKLVIAVGDNKELKDLLYKFQVNLMLEIK